MTKENILYPPSIHKNLLFTIQVPHNTQTVAIVRNSIAFYIALFYSSHLLNSMNFILLLSAIVYYVTKPRSERMRLLYCRIEYIQFTCELDPDRAFFPIVFTVKRATMMGH